MSVSDKKGKERPLDEGTTITVSNFPDTQPISGSVIVANPTTNPETGLATSVKQDSLSELIETLQELNQRLAPLGGAMANTAQLRSVVTGTVTASGPQTSAQFIATYNLAGVNYTRRVATENLNAVHSNINNVVIT